MLKDYIETVRVGKSILLDSFSKKNEFSFFKEIGNDNFCVPQKCWFAFFSCHKTIIYPKQKPPQAQNNILTPLILDPWKGKIKFLGKKIIILSSKDRAGSPGLKSYTTRKN